MDQERLLRMAGPHGLLPLLFSYVANDPTGVSSVTLERLQKHFAVNARRNLMMTAELLKTVGLLEEHGIPAVPFKGPLLAAVTYGNLSLRQFVDLDVLVRARDVTRASALLLARGYRLRDDPDFPEAALLRSQSERPFSTPGGAVLDLHWRFAAPYFGFSLDLDQVMPRLRWATLGGARVRSLGPEDLLLVLCVHGAKHCWERLEWICGVAEACRDRTLDWGLAIREAQRQRSLRMLLLGLRLADELLGAPIADEVRRRAREDPAARILAAEVRRDLLEGDRRAPSLPRSAWFHLRARERVADRVLYCVRLALTPTSADYALIPLPRALHALYCVLRPFRLAWKYGFRGRWAAADGRAVGSERLRSGARGRVG